MLPRGPERAHLERAEKRGVDVIFVVRCSSLVQLVETQRVACVVSELWDVEGQCVGTAIQSILRTFPEIPILLCLALEATTVRALSQVANLPEVRLLVRAHDDVVTEVVKALSSVPHHPATHAIEAVLQRHLPRHLGPLSEYLACAAIKPLTVAQIADAIHIPRRTLGDQLRRHELPPLERLVGWIRVLHAMWKLDGAGRTVDSVALELEFASGSALRHMVKRYTGHTPVDIWTSGGFPYLLRQFDEALARRAHMESNSLSDTSMHLPSV